ncbi:hypothetical protein JRQ81_001024, partial [Phrynocephalus forsythii]
MAQTQPSQTNQVLDMLSQLSMSQAKLISDQNSAFSSIGADMKEGFAKFDARMDSFCGRLQVLEDNKGVTDYRLEEIPMEELLREVDVIYRQHTAYTRRNKHPPEVIVKLVRRYTRDRILKAICNEEVKINESKVTILKDVPWVVRQSQKEYLFLTRLLLKHDIRYKWIYPEGLIFQWEGKIQNIDSYKKARIFAEKKKLGFSPTSPSSSTSE